MGDQKATTPRKGIEVECIYCKARKWLSEASKLTDMPPCDSKTCGGFMVVVQAAT
jgi:hypothetical protein